MPSPSPPRIDATMTADEGKDEASSPWRTGRSLPHRLRSGASPVQIEAQRTGLSHRVLILHEHRSIAENIALPRCSIGQYPFRAVGKRHTRPHRRREGIGKCHAPMITENRRKRKDSRFVLPSPKGCFHKNQPDRMREKRMAVPDPYENEQSCIHVFNKRNPKSTNCWNDRETLFHKKEAATINNEKPIRTPYENEQS